MKTKLFICLAVSSAVLALTANSCTCTSNNAQNTPQNSITDAQNAMIDTLRSDIAHLIDLAKNLNPAPFIQKDSKGIISLTEKEKMVKPDYLADPSQSHIFTTLSQKYRAIAVFGVDRIIADLYEMPITDYDDAIAYLVADIHDGAISQFVEKRHFTSEDLSTLIKGEYAIGRGPLFWEFLAASVVEQLYVLSSNIEKLLPLFDENNVAVFCENLNIVHEAFETLCQTNADMLPLRDALLPLYAIDAKTLDEFSAQLVEMKGAIELSRLYLSK